MTDLSTGVHKHNFFKELLKTPEHIANLNKGVHKAGDIANISEKNIKSTLAEAAKVAEENKNTDTTQIKTYKMGKSDSSAVIKLELNHEPEADKKAEVKDSSNKITNKQEDKANSMIDDLMKDN